MVDVSVIIACYNVERYIKRAIDSGLSQQGVSVEVIVVDDCSTDGTWGIVSGIIDSRLMSVRLPGNCGPGAARNAGIARASGEWIAILDGDDEFASGRLAQCIGRATGQRVDVVVDNLLVCCEADASEFLMFPSEALAKIAQLDAATFIRGTVSNNNNYTLGYLKPVFSRRFLERHKLTYDTELRIGEDYRLMMEVLLSGAHCAVEPSAGYRYTARATSISYRISPADIRRMIKADEQLMARYKLDSAAAIAQAGRTKWLKREYGYTLLVDAIKKKDGINMLKAIALHPSCIWLLWRPLQVRIQRLVA